MINAGRNRLINNLTTQNPDGTPMDVNTFAYSSDDPNGDIDFNQEMQWAKQYLANNPTWTGNSNIGVKNGQVVDNRSFLDKHAALLAGLGAAGVVGVGLAPALIGALGGGGAGGAATVPTAGIGTSAGGTTGLGAATVPSIATTTGLTAPIGVDVTAAGTAIPGAGGGLSAALGKLVNPKALASDAIKGLTSNKQQPQQSNGNPNITLPQVSSQTPTTTTPTNSIANQLASLMIQPNTAMPSPMALPSANAPQITPVAPNSNNIQTTVGPQDPMALFNQMLARSGNG